MQHDTNEAELHDMSNKAARFAITWGLRDGDPDHNGDYQPLQRAVDPAPAPEVNTTTAIPDVIQIHDAPVVIEDDSDSPSPNDSDPDSDSDSRSD